MSDDDFVAFESFLMGFYETVDDVELIMKECADGGSPILAKFANVECAFDPTKFAAVLEREQLPIVCDYVDKLIGVGFLRVTSNEWKRVLRAAAANKDSNALVTTILRSPLRFHLENDVKISFDTALGTENQYEMDACMYAIVRLDDTEVFRFFIENTTAGVEIDFHCVIVCCCKFDCRKLILSFTRGEFDKKQLLQNSYELYLNVAVSQKSFGVGTVIYFKMREKIPGTYSRASAISELSWKFYAI